MTELVKIKKNKIKASLKKEKVKNMPGKWFWEYEPIIRKIACV